MPLHYDVMFKYIFGTNKNIRFTRYLLDKFNICDKQMLKDIKIKNSVKITPESYKDKKFELDVLVELPSGDTINLEMYNKASEYSYTKSELYACRLLVKQLKSGKTYDNVKKIIQLNFIKKGKIKRRDKMTLFKMSDKVNNIYAKDNYLQIYDINIDYEEGRHGIPKEAKNIIRFMNANNKKDMKEIAKKDEVIQDMFEEMRVFSEGDDWITPCYDRDDLIRTEGLVKGREEGREEGKKETVLSVIQNMLANNVSEEDIAKYMNITIDEVKDIIKNNE